MKAKPFIHDDFLLESETARALYHEYAEQMPIIDYHCHLPPSEIAGDKHWENIAQVWLGGDHYKWRAMRTNGIDEEKITGNASDREKFDAFAETMPYLLRNPSYDWSHLELARYFGVTELLSPATADKIWKKTSAELAKPGFSARGLITRSNVELLCTTDDPTDSLAHHETIRESEFKTKVLPAWRPDRALAIDRPANWNHWLDRLGSATKIPIKTWEDFIGALQVRHDFFEENGCRLSDYGIERPYCDPYTMEDVTSLFNRVRLGGKATAYEIAKFRSAALYEMIAMDARADWTVQIHYGVYRNMNTKMFKRLGPDTGFDTIGDVSAALGLCRIFDRLERNDILPRTILYPINPCDNEIVATCIGCFQKGPEPGRLQFGSGWWFNDQRDGMTRQIESLSQLGLLSRFVGMLTDSRSFLSYTRHEYFRRVLCNILGEDVTKGRLPNDLPWIGEIVKDICYRNAKRYFKFA